MSPKRSQSAPLNPVAVYLQEIDASPLLSPAEEQILAEQKEAGDAEASEHLIQSNLRLVVSIARTKVRMGLSLQDAIQSGNLGLIKGTKKFKARNIRFSTFGSYCIEREINRTADDQRGTIHIPHHVQDFQRKVAKRKEALHSTLGREPTDEEMREAMELEKRKWESKKKLSAHAVMAKKANAKGENVDVLQLDQRISHNEKDPALVLQQQETMQVMLNLIKSLEPDQQEIIRMRYLTLEGGKTTHKEIGEVLDMSVTQVRKRERKTLAQLRALLGAQLGLTEHDVFDNDGY
ncbi:sigma-70 family RNA polymerase sigma factor [Candidatus Peribacteria bacterium]|nr:MAG: sigma-70 family RNA polymerase sigma factor [Candidatus Peribacteria bacterium]